MKERDSFNEAVPGCDHKIDVVDVFSATEAMGEIVPGVDAGTEFSAVLAEKAESALDAFGVRRVVDELLNGKVHGQIVAQGAQQVTGDHERSP